MGIDSYILASLGCNLHLCEANPQIYALLADAKIRALNSADQQVQQIAARMQIYYGNSLELIAQIAQTQSIDIIYFDPMFPKSKKSALPKNSMQVLQQIATLNTLEQESALFQIAQHHAKLRIVVKRHKSSAFFANLVPQAQIIGKTNRFDLYMGHTPHIDTLERTLS